LICFWVYVFCGGINGPIVKILFPVKVALVLVVFTVLQVSFPKIRSADSAELTARWLLRLCLIGFFMEAVWIGVRG
ncbi:MAG: NADH-quinone oxidoreductase subunit H, partial [Bdellovibrionota bacterium]